MMKPDILYILKTDHPGTAYNEAGYWKDTYFYIKFDNGIYKFYYTDIATNSFETVKVIEKADPETFELIEYIKGLATAGKIRNNLIFSIDEALNISESYKTYKEFTTNINEQLKSIAGNNYMLKLIIYGGIPLIIIAFIVYLINKLR